MPIPGFRYLQKRRTRHGKMTYYFRRSKRERLIRIRGVYGSEEFKRQYFAALRGEALPPAPVEKDQKNTLGWLIGLYMRSRDWGELLSPATRRQRSHISSIAKLDRRRIA
jgi:hypothetical protein